EGGPQPPALPVRSGEAAREPQAGRRAPGRAARGEAREAAPRRAGGAGQAGRGARQGAGGGAEGRRGDAAAGGRMSVLLFVEGGDELSLQAATVAQALGEVAAIRFGGADAPSGVAEGAG